MKLYGTYKITAYDLDGDVVQESTIEDAGSFTIEELKTNALVHGVDEIKVTPLSVETRDEDGNTELKIEGKQ